MEWISYSAIEDLQTGLFEIRKMHCLSVVLPNYIREHKYLVKSQKVEQGGERLHKQFNDLEYSFRNKFDLPKKVPENKDMLSKIH